MRCTKYYLPFHQLLINMFIYQTCQETGAKIRICGIKAGTGEKVIPLTKKVITMVDTSYALSGMSTSF